MLQVLAFLSQGIIDESKKNDKLIPSDHLQEGEEYIQERNSLFILLKRPVIFEEGDNPETPWKEISIKDIHKTLKDIDSKSKTRRAQLESRFSNYTFVGSFSVLICGSKKNYWLEPEVDLSAIIGDAEARETSFIGMSSTTKLDILNQGIFGSDNISGNIINSLPFEANLFSFKGEGAVGAKSIGSIPTYLLLDYDVAEDDDLTENNMNTSTFSAPHSFTITGGEPGDGIKTTSMAKKDIHYKTHINNILKTITGFMGYHLAFQNLYKNNFNQYKKNAARIREDIQGLQSDINGILLGDAETKRRKSKTGVVKGSKPTEDDIIYSSSVFSSSFTEIDENVSNLILFLTDRGGTVERMEDEAKLDSLKEAPLLGNVITKLTEELKVWRGNILTSFERLRRNLTNSQNRLRNTIDVFNTYRESKRRKGQKRMANTLNFIFSALAIIELSDFLGGLVTYGLSNNDWSGAGIMFLEAVGFLLLIALFIYIFVLRKMWKEK